MLKLVELLAAEGAVVADVIGRLAQKTGGAKAGVVHALAGSRLHHLHHGADDVALGVELAGVTGRVGSHALEQVFVNLREDDDIGLAGEVQLVDLLHHPGEARRRGGSNCARCRRCGGSAGPARRCPAPFRLRAGELDPELAVDKLQHLVRMVGVLGPMAPGVFAAQAALVGRVVEGGFLLLARFGFVEGLEEEEPGELLDVVARIHAFGVELIAGVLDDLLHFLAAVVDVLLRHVRSCVRLGRPLRRPSARKGVSSPVRGRP